jgi:hypothetical protein
MIDAYIDRIKSVAFAGFLALTLSLGVAASRQALSQAYRQVQTWYWIDEIFRAELPITATIDSVDHMPVAQWQQLHGDLPVSSGTLLDAIRNNSVSGVISGRINLPGEVASTYSAELSPLSQDDCTAAAPGARCFQWSTTMDSRTLSVTFRYRKLADGSKSWTVWDPVSRQIFDPMDAEDRIRVLAKPWAETNDSVRSAYAAIVRVKEEQKIKIPVVDLEIPVQFATVALALFALVSAYLNAIAYTGLEEIYCAEKQETPWILAPHDFPRSSEQPTLRRVLSALSVMTAHASIWLPMAVILVALWLSPGWQTTLLVLAAGAIVLILLIHCAGCLSTLVPRGR